MTKLIAATLLSAVTASILWFELIYLWFGATGRDAGSAGKTVVALVSLAAAMTWSLRGADRPARAVWNASRLGIAVSVAMPVVAVAVLLMWEWAEGRPDLGMGGMMLYSVPVVAFVLSAILVVFFATARKIAGRSMTAHEPPPDAHQS